MVDVALMRQKLTPKTVRRMLKKIASKAGDITLLPRWKSKQMVVISKSEDAFPVSRVLVSGKDGGTARVFTLFGFLVVACAHSVRG